MKITVIHTIFFERYIRGIDYTFIYIYVRMNGPSGGKPIIYYNFNINNNKHWSRFFIIMLRYLIGIAEMLFVYVYT